MSAALAPAGTRRRGKRPRDVRALAIVFVAVSIASLAYLVTLLPGRGVDGSTKVAAERLNTAFSAFSLNTEACSICAERASTFFALAWLKATRSAVIC